MATPKYNLALNRGESFEKNIQIIQSTGTPLNLTGYTVDSNIKATYTDVSASAAFTCSISSATNGQFVMQLHPSSSRLLTGSCYLYDVRITSGSEVQYILEGKVHVSPSVTV